MLIITVLWILLVSDKPEDAVGCVRRIKIGNRMSPAEVDYIVTNRPDNTFKPSLKSVPWKRIFSDCQVYLIAFTWSAMQYLVYNGANNIPTFLNRVHNIPITTISNAYGITVLVAITLICGSKFCPRRIDCIS